MSFFSTLHSYNPNNRTYLLDELPGALYAGGTIRLLRSFSGPVVTGAASYSLFGDRIDSSSVGGIVTTLTDQNGSSRILTQSNATWRPTIATDGNGVRGIRFGASGAIHMLDTSAFSSLPQPLTLYAMCSSTLAMGRTGRLFDSQSTGNYALVKVNGQWWLYNQTGLLKQSTGGTVGCEKVALVLNGASSRIHIGNQVHTFDASTHTFDDGIRIGAASNETDPIDGLVYAVAVYGAAHTTGQVATAFSTLTYPALSPLLLVDGDSNAYGTGLTLEEARIHNRIAAKFADDGITIETFNDGNPGQALINNADYIYNVLSQVVSTRKCMVLLQQGTVDLSSGISASTIASSFETYMTAANAIGAGVLTIANTVLAASVAVHTAPQEAQRLLLNTAIRGSLNPDVICDTAALTDFATQGVVPNTKYADGVHFSNLGTLDWVNELYPDLKTAFDAL